MMLMPNKHLHSQLLEVFSQANLPAYNVKPQIKTKGRYVQSVKSVALRDSMALHLSFILWLTKF